MKEYVLIVEESWGENPYGGELVYVQCHMCQHEFNVWRSVGVYRIGGV